MKTTIPACTVGYVLYGPRGSERVLLGEKAPTEKALKRGIAGKLIGFGGDIEEFDADPVSAFVRELGEESGDAKKHLSVDPADVEIMARIEIRNEARPSLILYFLVARNTRGEAAPTRELSAFKEYPVDELPENILDADKIILPRIFKGEKLEGWLLYSKDMRVILHELRAVDAIQ